MNDPRGSVWRKWDLHVHTPDSLVQSYGGTDAWDKFIDALSKLPPEFKVLGINDYIFLDGYKKVAAAHADGRLPNLELVLPVIELRLDKFGGSEKHISKVNFHVIFSNELPPETIESQFLNRLDSEYTLTPEIQALCKSGRWSGIPTRQSLTDLGEAIIASVPEHERGRYGTPIKEGFNTLCFTLDAIKRALKSPYFTDKALTAVGKTEWANIRWNDTSIAEKKNIINAADLVFISSETPADWREAHDSLRAAKVNARLLDCSDAHAFPDSTIKDRLGNCFTWIKADPTFEGLRQTVREYDGRVYVGEMPEKLDQVQKNKTKYIQMLSIKRKPAASLPERWFDNIAISLNPELVAVIGNKGRGKSAFTDIIGLLSNTKQHGDFTFLSDKNFRQPKDNKAKHFCATLTWESGVTSSKGLDEAVDTQQPELVKYLPQNFLEKICTQHGRIEETDFDRELKKVIFSHVEMGDRLDKGSLDDLLAYKTSEAVARIRLLQQELHAINAEITAQEKQLSPEYTHAIENLLAVKREELTVHNSAPPTPVAKPTNDAAEQAVVAEAAKAVEMVMQEQIECEKEIKDATAKIAELSQLMAVIDKLIHRLANLQHQIQTFSDDSKADLAAVGLTEDAILKVKLDAHPLHDRRNAVFTHKARVVRMLDPKNPDGLIYKQKSLQTRVTQLQAKLDEPNKAFRAYQASLAEWETQRQAILGSENVPGTIKYCEHQLQVIESIPSQLSAERELRLKAAKEIHAVIRQLADTYRELYAPVNDFIKRQSVAGGTFELNCEVGIVDVAFERTFFEKISRKAAGTFCGVEEAHKMIGGILARHDFNSEQGVVGFLNDVMNALENDRRPNGKAVRMAEQLKDGVSTVALYDMIFSLDYLKPRYALRMGNKELHELSPGERGALLLVFYLLVDNSDIPLVIDQPEENLDNQTIYELLVPCIKEAKRKRQIVIVTHNPNLAVVCDAEQIIRANLDKTNNYLMEYLPGAIENPKINRAIVDVLEGTMPAFDNRRIKYLPL